MPPQVLVSEEFTGAGSKGAWDNQSYVPLCSEALQLLLKAFMIRQFLSFWSCVTILSLSCTPLTPTIHLPRKNHRYNGNHEEGVGVQAKEHQGMVDWMV